MWPYWRLCSSFIAFASSVSERIQSSADAASSDENHTRSSLAHRFDPSATAASFENQSAGGRHCGMWGRVRVRGLRDRCGGTYVDLPGQEVLPKTPVVPEGIVGKKCVRCRRIRVGYASK